MHGWFFFLTRWLGWLAGSRSRYPSYVEGVLVKRPHSPVCRFDLSVSPALLGLDGLGLCMCFFLSRLEVQGLSTGLFICFSFGVLVFLCLVSCLPHVLVRVCETF